MTAKEIKAIQSAYERIRRANIPIKLIRDEDWPDEDIRTIVRTMREQLDWVKEHPNEGDPYGTSDADWQEEYVTLTALADMRGIDLSDFVSAGAEADNKTTNKK